MSAAPNGRTLDCSKQAAGEASSNGIVRLTEREIQLPVRALGRRHRDYGVRAEDYDTAGGALLWALARVLGPPFDVEHQSAWLRLYRGLATVMLETSDARYA